MKLKFGHIIASLSMVLSSQAYALSVDEINAIPPTHVLYVGGGAEQNGVFETIASKLFTAGSVSYITDDTGAPPAKGRSFRAVAGTVSVGSLAGQNWIVAYRSLGGVFANGIAPLVTPNPPLTNYYQIQNNITTTGLANPTFKITNLSNFVPGQRPAIGLANLELAIFTGSNLPAGASALTAGQLAQLVQTPLYNVVNGIAATNNLADALVAATLAGHRPASLDNGLSKAEIAGILSGTITNWTQVQGLEALDKPVILIDRNAGSGAKAAANQYFLNNPGGSAFSGAIPPANQGAEAGIGDIVNFASYAVRTEPSSGNVPGALDNVFNKGAYGIGILGLENAPSVTSKWRFVAISGARATNPAGTAFDKQQAISGQYDYFFQASVNLRKSVTGDQLALANAFISKAKDTAVITTVAGTVLDPAEFPETGNATLDAFRAHGTRFGNSTAPLQLLEPPAP